MKRVDLASDGQPSGDTVATGFPSVDRWLGGGIRRGDLVVLGGDVGSGKSALALAMALRMSQTGAPVAFMTGEMTPERVMERALAVEGRRGGGRHGVVGAQESQRDDRIRRPVFLQAVAAFRRHAGP